MTMLSMKARRSGLRATGFSLLEVLIAIVVLSVGLLALAPCRAT
jgi:prepilin-type N-terminal cleavage/methylation domain-containing protein